MKVLLFASVKEMVGQDNLQIPLDQDKITPAQIRALVKGATGADQSL